MKLAPIVALLALLQIPGLARADEVEDLRQALKDERTRAAQVQARARQEISDLRERLTKAEDALIERGRDFDQAQRHLHEKVEGVQREALRLERDAQLEQARLQSKVSLLRARVSQLEQESGKPQDENDILELRVSLVFRDTSLEEVLSYLEEICGLTFHVHEDRQDLLEDAKLSLRLHELPLRVALELVLLNAAVGDSPIDLTWRREDDGIYLQ